MILRPQKLQKQEHGLALLMTMVLLFVLVIIITEMMFTSEVHKIISENLTEEHLAFYGEEAILLRVEEVLFQDIQPPPMKPQEELFLTPEEQEKLESQKGTDSYHDYWASFSDVEESGGSLITARVFDEERKFNVNTLFDPKSNQPIQKRVELFKEILKAMGIKETEHRSFVDEIKDYTDKNTTGKYEDLAPNRPLQRIKEMIPMEHVGEEIYYGLNYPQGELSFVEEKNSVNFDFNDFDDEDAEKVKDPFQSVKAPPYEEWEDEQFIPGVKDVFTVYGEGKINVNTAPFPVLLAMFNQDEEVAKDVIIERKKKAFKTVGDLATVTGASERANYFSDLITFKSNYFRVEVSIKNKHILRQRVSVMMRDGPNALTLFRGASL